MNDFQNPEGLRGLMPLVRSIVLVSSLTPVTVSAQSFTYHTVGLGFEIGLPAAWVLDSRGDLVALREMALDTMRESDLEYLRQLAAENENAPLMCARHPDRPLTSMSVNVTVNEQFKPDMFEVASEAEREEFASVACEDYRSLISAAGGSAMCTDHFFQTLANRTAMVVHQVSIVPSRGMDNRRVVAMLPADGLLFTIYVSEHREHYDEATAMAILASIRMLER